MEINISLITIFRILVIAALMIVLLIPRKKEYTYNRLDKTGVVLNIVLSLIYVPLSLAGVVMVFFADNPTGLTEVQLGLLYAGIYCGIAVPLISIVSIFLSVITRREGKSKFSFCIQFLPILVFTIALGLCICATIH